MCNMWRILAGEATTPCLNDRVPLEPRWCVLPVPLLQAGATLAGAVRFELDRAGGARLPVLNELLQITSVACTASLEDPDSEEEVPGPPSCARRRAASSKSPLAVASPLQVPHV